MVASVNKVAHLKSELAARGPRSCTSVADMLSKGRENRLVIKGDLVVTDNRTLVMRNV